MEAEPYGIDEPIHSGEIYDALNTFLSDLPFYERWCRVANGSPIVEFCCGTGRLTIPLAAAGLPIAGVDASENMLEWARKKASAKGLDVSFHHGDMRAFRHDEFCGLVFIPFSSLQCIYTLEDVERVFANVKAHLLPEGHFVFDVFNPDIYLMVRRDGDPVEHHEGTLSDGRQVVVRERCRYDSAGQVNRVTWYIGVGDEETVARLDMRCFYPLELDALLKYNGFQVLHKFGAFDESPFSASSPRQIYVCRVA